VSFCDSKVNIWALAPLAAVIVKVTAIPTINIFMISPHYSFVVGRKPSKLIKAGSK
jgi:hypothetical protein